MNTGEEFGPSALGRAEPDINGRDSVGLYLEEIGRHPLLTPEQVVELSKSIEAGLYAQHKLENESESFSDQERAELEWLSQAGREAKYQFVVSNLRLVVSIARKYGPTPMPFADMIQEGNTGLIRAVEKFDYKKGYKFSTYGTLWIRQAITRGRATQERIVRVPVHVFEEINQVRKAKRSLENQHGVEPSPEAIAAELEMEAGDVEELLGWSRDHVSLDTPVGDDGRTTLVELFEDSSTATVEDMAVSHDIAEEWQKYIDSLDDERLQDIIRSRFGLKDGRFEKVNDISQRHGISVERVRQLEKTALAKLRQIVPEEAVS